MRFAGIIWRDNDKDDDKYENLLELGSKLSLSSSFISSTSISALVLPLEEAGMILNLIDLWLGRGGGITVFLFLGFSCTCLLLPGVIEAEK